MKHPFTVTGYHPDNNQPWVAHVDAEDAAQAAPLGAAKIAESNDGSADVRVVEVFKGHHRGQLENEETIPLSFSEDSECDDEFFTLDDDSHDGDS